MNPVNQSLSNLLRNPALQGEGAAPQRASQRSTSAQTGGENLTVSDAARQSLARANAAAALPVLEDLAQAEGLTRMVREALSGGISAAAQAHRPVDPQVAQALLR